MTMSVVAPSDTVNEAAVRIDVQLSRNARFEQMERVHCNARRFGSALGLVASVVSIYDLSLLAGLGH